MILFAKNILSAGLGGLALGVLALPARAAPPAALPANLPLYFETNRGQASAPAPFIARGRDYQFLISPTEVQIALRRTATETAVARMQFVGANAQASISGGAELPGKINYFIGNDPAQWRSGVPTFAQVHVGELYPGVNLVYYGNQQQLEYDFRIAPGADPNAIRIHFDGVDRISVGQQGELVLILADAEIRQPKPAIYQTVGGARKEIAGSYRLLDRHTVTFAIGQYDHTLPLIVDPVLSYSTYFGGTSGTTAWAVALDTNGFIYVAGQTFSEQFYTPGAFQTNYNGGTLYGDAFVAKFDNLGTNLIYLTYLGGSADDTASSLAVDGAGNVYLTGYTCSTNFPVTNSTPGYNGVPGLSTNIGGKYNAGFGNYLFDAFVVELNTNGSRLIYSTYLGGSGVDGGTGVAVDSSGNVYVTGFTSSTNFPVRNPIPYRLAGRTNAFLDHLACTNSLFFNYNAFIAKIGPNGTNLVFSSYFGGTNFDMGESVAIDSSNNVYVAGFTASTNFPNTNSFQKCLNGATNNTPAYDAFVAKFDPTGTNLLYSTFLGGANEDLAYHIAVDGSGNAYVTGSTTSTNFPNTATNVPYLSNGLTNNSYYGYTVTTNAFLTQIRWNGTNASIGYSAVFGGNNMDIGYGVAVDSASNVFVVGATTSTNFPVTTNNIPDASGLLRATNSGGSDVFIIAFNTNASALLYSAYLGGSADDFGYGIAVDMNGNAYVVGQTLSANFPTLNARQTTRNGTNDAFLAKIILTVQLPVILVQPTNQTVGVNSNATFSVTVTGGTPPFFYQWQTGGTNLTDGTTISGSTISGSTNATLTISNAHTNDSGTYSVIVTNYGGAVTSSPPASLTVKYFPPYLTLQPTSQTVGVGATVTFLIDGYAALPRFLQWQKNGTNLADGTNVSGSIISGSTNNPLTISNAQTNDDGGYSIIVTNYGGSVTSSVAFLTVVAFPTITVPPTNQTVGLGSTVTFAVTAVGLTPLNYCWQENGTNLVNGGRISGVTNFTLTITNAQTSDEGGYSVIVTNIVGSVTSSPPAVLTVLTSPLFRNITVAGGTNGGFILSGVGGTNSGTYYVLTTTNLALPLTNWTPVATNQFDSLGGFIFTNAEQTNAPQLFYILKRP